MFMMLAFCYRTAGIPADSLCLFFFFLPHVSRCRQDGGVPWRSINSVDLTISYMINLLVNLSFTKMHFGKVLD